MNEMHLNNIKELNKSHSELEKERLNRASLNKENNAKFFEHHQDLLPLADDILSGKNINVQYNLLDKSQRLSLCQVACAKLSEQLDDISVGDEISACPTTVDYLGKFLQTVEGEIVLFAVRGEIGIDRMVRWNLDENSEWQFLTDINQAVGN